MSTTTVDPPRGQAKDVVFELNDLPPELRIVFFDSLAWDSSCPSSTGGNRAKLVSRGHLATYRLVCREWHAHFDKYFFHNVAVYQHELPQLRMLSSRQRSFIRYLCLRVEALSAACLACAALGDETIWLTNNQIVKRVLCDLFNVLGSWGEECHVVTLEIAVEAHRLQVKRRHRPRSNYHRTAITKLFGDLVSADALLTIPQLHTIKRLVICRQFRNASWPTTLRRIFQVLPELEHVQFEVPVPHDERRWFPWGQEPFQGLLNTVPRGPRHIAFAERNAEGEVRKNLGVLDNVIPASPLLALLPQHENAESLHAFFLNEAPGLLETLREGPVWQNLTKLTITSYRLGPGPDSEWLLSIAASVARKMPKLQIFEVWCGGPGRACLFRYRATNDLTMEISSRGTVDIPFPPRVVQAWSEVCLENTGKSLWVRETELIDAELIGSVDDAIHHLGLVLDPRVVRATG